MKRAPNPAEARKLVGDELIRAFAVEAGLPVDMVELLAALALPLVKGPTR